MAGGHLLAEAGPAVHRAYPALYAPPARRRNPSLAAADWLAARQPCDLTVGSARLPRTDRGTVGQTRDWLLLDGLFEGCQGLLADQHHLALLVQGDCQ